MRRILHYLALVVPLLLLVACGGDDGGDSDGIEVGASAPDFTLPDASGGEVSLADYAGQPVLLYFHMAMG